MMSRRKTNWVCRQQQYVEKSLNYLKLGMSQTSVGDSWKKYVFLVGNNFYFEIKRQSLK